MFLELLFGVYLWIGYDLNSGAELRVNCDQVEIWFSDRPSGEYMTLVFTERDPEFQYDWKYHVPMEISNRGTLLLEPTLYWIHEIRELDKLEFRVGKQNLVFPLQGSKKAIQCNGDVAE